MLDAIGKYVGARVVTALCTVAAVAAGIWFWRHPEDLRALWTVVRLTLAWIGLAAALPWTCILFIKPLLKLESNAASGAMLAGFGLIDIVAGLWLAGWNVSGALSWTVLILGFITAAVYNFVVCESLARRADG